MNYYPDQLDNPRRRARRAANVRPTRTRILIADDDEDCRELVSLALHAPGTEICMAASGAELIELVAEGGPFDLIVTDINMPWMEGLQVLASIREAGLTTPALVITGVTRPDLQASVERMGNARLLCKPFGIAALREAIAALFAGEALP
jgi:CheY-like chemotaxis protein